MSFINLFEFLEELQKNNSKDWMDANRDRYRDARDFFIDWLDAMNDRLSGLDQGYHFTPGKKAINRINNNLMYHPNRPVYKDHFGAGLDQLSKQGDFYIEIGIDESFAGGGYWHPNASTLRSIREAIDYDGERLKAILNNESFIKNFGGLIQAEKLKTAPKGYSGDHKHIELLRMKSFAAVRNFSREEIVASDFNDKVIETYFVLLPFRRYLNQAVSV